MAIYNPGAQIRVPFLETEAESRIRALLATLDFQTEAAESEHFVIPSGFYAREIHRFGSFVAVSVRIVNGDEEFMQLHLHTYHRYLDRVFVAWPRVNRHLQARAQAQAADA